MRFNILMPLLLCLPAVASAQALGSQQQTVEVARNYTDVFDSGFNIVSYDLKASQLRGTPFLLSSWMPGEIMLIGNRKSTQVPMKYDLVRQQLRVRRAQGDSIIVPVNQVQEFILMGTNTAGSVQQRRFVHYTHVNTPPELKEVCLEVLSNGQQVQLLKYWRKVVIKSQENSTNMALSTTVRSYEAKDRYYLRQTSDGKMTEIKLKRASLQNALVTQPEALATLKKRRGSISSEADLEAVVTEIDPLIKSSAN